MVAKEAKDRGASKSSRVGVGAEAPPLILQIVIDIVVSTTVDATTIVFLILFPTLLTTRQKRR